MPSVPGLNRVRRRTMAALSRHAKKKDATTPPGFDPVARRAQLQQELQACQQRLGVEQQRVLLLQGALALLDEQLGPVRAPVP